MHVDRPVGLDPVIDVARLVVVAAALFRVAFVTGRVLVVRTEDLVLDLGIRGLVLLEIRVKLVHICKGGPSQVVRART